MVSRGYLWLFDIWGKGKGWFCGDFFRLAQLLRCLRLLLHRHLLSHLWQDHWLQSCAPQTCFDQQALHMVICCLAGLNMVNAPIISIFVLDCLQGHEYFTQKSLLNSRYCFGWFLYKYNTSSTSCCGWHGCHTPFDLCPKAMCIIYMICISPECWQWITCSFTMLWSHWTLNSAVVRHLWLRRRHLLVVECARVKDQGWRQSMEGSTFTTIKPSGTSTYATCVKGSV